jgi:hypothetical protein
MDEALFRSKIVSSIREEFGEDVDLVDEQTIKKAYGWIVFYNTRDFIETGDPMVGLMSNAPLLCLWDGRMWPLAMHCTVQEAIRGLEAELSLA